MSIARRVILVAMGALIIVLSLGVVAVVRSDGVPAPQPVPTPAAVEQTVLLQLLDADGYSLGNVILGIEPPEAEPLTIFLALPASVLVTEGDDSVTLGSTPSSPDTLAAVTAVQDGLGVRLDAGLSLDRLAFAGLVDAVDGVWILLDRPILLPAIEQGEWRTLGPGWVKMDGVAAADYAVLRLPGEGEQARTDRFLLVLQKTLGRLPRNVDQMRQVLTSLGSLARSTVPSEGLASFFVQVRSDIAAERLRSQTLPVDVIRGGLRPASVPGIGAEQLVQTLFPDARMSPPAAEMTG
jgi:hypothetical protein